MFKYNCLNPIASVGLDNFDENYTKTEDVNEAEGILVRSAAMHEMDFSDKLLCVARAGAGVNNIPLDKLAQKGVVVFNTPGANANGVKELAICAMLLASSAILTLLIAVPPIILLDILLAMVYDKYNTLVLHIQIIS